MTAKNKINRYVVVTPAYGCDYHSKREAELAFRNGKDFQLEDMFYRGNYCSIRDFEPGTSVEIRYAKREKLAIVKV